MTDWHALLGEYANELIGWAHSEGRAIIHQRKEYNYMAIKRYCVMCLADGERNEAARVIDGAGYCRACLVVRRDAGLSTTEDAKPKAESKRHGKQFTVSPVVHIPVPPEVAEPQPEPTPFDGPGPELYAKTTDPAIAQPTEPESFRVLVAFDVTHEQADGIWRELPLEEKAAFVQNKLIERWNRL